MILPWRANPDAHIDIQSQFQYYAANTRSNTDKYQSIRLTFIIDFFMFRGIT